MVSRVPGDGHYREVVTPHALELSGLIERLRDRFVRLIDGCSKFEFYGRLEVAANRAIRKRPDLGAADLCLAVLDEAEVQLGEIRRSDFTALPVALGASIAYDFRRW